MAATVLLKLSSVEVFLFVAFLTLLSFGNLADGKHDKTKTKANQGVASVRSTVSLWGNFAGKLIYEGCFEISDQPSKIRVDSQNNNFYCNEFCTEEGKMFSATSEDQCLCLDNLPSKRIEQDKCNSRCPDADYEERGRSCGGFGCCGSRQNKAVSVYKHAGEFQTMKRTLESGNFEVQGCFDDEKKGIIKSQAGRERIDSANTALRCAEFCSEKGYGVVSLRYDLCACNNDLPLNRLYKDTDNSKECKMRCKGVLASTAPCEKEECCGGSKPDKTPVYTVIVVGNVDVLRQVMSRIHGNFRSDSALRPLEQEFGVNSCGKDWTYFKGSCVRYFENKTKSYSDAKKACDSHNAKLLTLNYEQDIDAFPAPPKTTCETYYVGLEYGHGDARTWFWVSGEPLTYNAIDEPNAGEYLNGSCGGLTMNQGADKRRYVVLFNETCKGGWFKSSQKRPFICQRFGKVSAVATKQTSEGTTLLKYTLNMKHPEAIEIIESAADTQSDKINLSLEELEEKMTQKDDLRSEILASNGVKFFGNKQNSMTKKFTYQDQVHSSEKTEVSITVGMSFKVGISTAFSTKLFGVAGFKISGQFSATGSWKKGNTATSVKSKMESYSFEFTVPEKCDARISIMKEFIPVRTDWRSKFHISGKVEVSLMDKTKALDISRLISGPDRYVYGFGYSKFNEDPAIVPKETLDCIDQKQSTITLNENKIPVTVKAEKY